MALPTSRRLAACSALGYSFIKVSPETGQPHPWPSPCLAGWMTHQNIPFTSIHICIVLLGIAPHFDPKFGSLTILYHSSRHHHLASTSLVSNCLHDTESWVVSNRQVNFAKVYAALTTVGYFGCLTSIPFPTFMCLVYRKLSTGNLYCFFVKSRVFLEILPESLPYSANALTCCKTSSFYFVW